MIDQLFLFDFLEKRRQTQAVEMREKQKEIKLFHKIEDTLIHEYGNIISRNRYNGGYKSLTKNCKGCSANYIIDNHEICYLGGRWKFLARGKKLRKCQYIEK